MRVTSNMSNDNSIYNIQQSQSKLYKTNELIGTQRNISRPSDDSVNSKLLLDIGYKLKANDQYLSNIAKSDTWQHVTSDTLTAMSDIMTLAKEQVATITSGSSDATIRQNVVTQLQTLKQQMVDMGNMQLGDQYIFGGAKNSVKPFSITSPYYSGDETAINIEVGKENTQQINIEGNRLLTADTALSQPYGSTNVLKAFDDLITAVNANDVTAIVAGAQALEAGAKQINNAQSDVAGRLVRLDATTKIIENNRNTLETIYTNIQYVDNAKLAVELNQQQIAYEATLSATAKISKLSLLDYI